MLVVRGAEAMWSVGPEVASAVDDVLDATGCVVTPGLVNAHHHLLQSAFRTLPGTRHVRMAEWLGVMGAAYRNRRVDPELVHLAARVGLAESLLCGVTTVWDHHLTWPAGVDPVAVASATATAAAELGARLVFVRGTAGDDADEAAASVERIVAALPDVEIAVGPAGVHSDGPETFAALGAVAARLGLPRRTQANEQVDVERAAERYGRRPLELLDEWGWLAPDVTVAHLCDVTPDEVERVTASGAAFTHAPGCDLPSGWGVAPVGALLDAGVAVGLGTSGGGSNDAGHLLADARLAMQVSPLAGRALTADEVLTMATRGSAPGDLCCWDVSDVFDAGVADPVAGLVWTSPGRRPKHVVVRGEVVVRDGVLVRADSRAVAADLRAELARRTP